MLSSDVYVKLKLKENKIFKNELEDFLYTASISIVAAYIYIYKSICLFKSIYLSRYLLCANLGDTDADVFAVNGLFAGGEVVVDTSGQLQPGDDVRFKSHSAIPPYQALVIKLPK